MTEINTNEKIVSLPYLLTENMLTITAPDGSAKCMDANHPNFQTVLLAVREGRWEDALREIDVKEVLAETEGFDIRNGKVYVNERELPTRLGSYVINIVSMRMSLDPLLKFWDNLDENPSNRAVERLFEFLEQNQHPLTEDGCFIAYKGVRDDWTDCHTGKIDNSIGNVVKMPRNRVNENPNETCSYGLHVGNHEAARRYWGSSGHLLVVKVNPRDVVAIPFDYGEAKMRICEYTVLQETDKDKHLNDTPVYTPPTPPEEPESDDDDDDVEDDWNVNDECSECGCVDCICDNCSECGASCEANCICGMACPLCESIEIEVDDTDKDGNAYQWNCRGCHKSFRRCDNCDALVGLTNCCSNCGAEL